jgi:hypothetical protein
MDGAMALHLAAEAQVGTLSSCLPVYTIYTNKLMAVSTKVHIQIYNIFPHQSSRLKKNTNWFDILIIFDWLIFNLQGLLYLHKYDSNFRGYVLL